MVLSGPLSCGIGALNALLSHPAECTTTAEYPVVSIRFCNGDHGHDDIGAKHRTHDPKKGGDHIFPPLGEPPAHLI